MKKPFYILLSTICLCCALPALPTTPSIDLSSSTTDVSEGRKYEVGEPETRQGALLAVLGASLAPIVASLLRPALSQVASTVFGKIQEIQKINEAQPINYDAYMINSPHSPGPYLFLTNPKIENNENHKNTKRPSELQIPASSLLSTETLSSSHPTFSFGKPPAIRKHIGRITIKSQLPEDDESKEKENLSELRIINSPSYDIYSDEMVARRRSGLN